MSYFSGDHYENYIVVFVIGFGLGLWELLPLRGGRAKTPTPCDR